MNRQTRRKFRPSKQACVVAAQHAGVTTEHFRKAPLTAKMLIVAQVDRECRAAADASRDGDQAE